MCQKDVTVEIPPWWLKNYYPSVQQTCDWVPAGRISSKKNRDRIDRSVLFAEAMNANTSFNKKWYPSQANLLSTIRPVINNKPSAVILVPAPRRGYCRLINYWPGLLRSSITFARGSFYSSFLTMTRPLFQILIITGQEASFVNNFCERIFLFLLFNNNDQSLSGTSWRSDNWL